MKKKGGREGYGGGGREGEGERKEGRRKYWEEKVGGD